MNHSQVTESTSNISKVNSRVYLFHEISRHFLDVLARFDIHLISTGHLKHIGE